MLTRHFSARSTERVRAVPPSRQVRPPMRERALGGQHRRNSAPALAPASKLPVANARTVRVLVLAVLVSTSDTTKVLWHARRRRCATHSHGGRGVFFWPLVVVVRATVAILARAAAATRAQPHILPVWRHGHRRNAAKCTPGLHHGADQVHRDDAGVRSRDGEVGDDGRAGHAGVLLGVASHDPRRLIDDIDVGDDRGRGGGALQEVGPSVLHGALAPKVQHKRHHLRGSGGRPGRSGAMCACVWRCGVSQR